MLAKSIISSRIAISEKPLTNLKFLDVGCGIGTKALLASHFFDAYGLEINPPYAQKAIKLLGNDKIIQDDALKFDKYGDFDVIYAYQPMLNSLKLFDKIAEQAKPNAIFLGFFGDYPPLSNIYDESGSIKIKKSNNTNELIDNIAKAKQLKMCPDCELPIIDDGKHMFEKWQLLRILDRLDGIEKYAPSLIPEEHHPYLPLPTTTFSDLLQQALKVLEVLHSGDKSKIRACSFLDVGCGIGTKLLLAKHFFRPYGIEINPPFVEAINRQFEFGSMVTQEDALEYKNYNNYDIIYSYWPMKNKTPTLFRKIMAEASPNTIFLEIAPFGEYSDITLLAKQKPMEGVCPIAIKSVDENLIKRIKGNLALGESS